MADAQMSMLLDLPGELRNQILKEVASRTKAVIHGDRFKTNSKQLPDNIVRSWSEILPTHPLSQTCRQLRGEFACLSKEPSALGLAEIIELRLTNFDVEWLHNACDAVEMHTRHLNEPKLLYVVFELDSQVDTSLASVVELAKACPDEDDNDDESANDDNESDDGFMCQPCSNLFDTWYSVNFKTADAMSASKTTKYRHKARPISKKQISACSKRFKDLDGRLAIELPGNHPQPGWKIFSQIRSGFEGAEDDKATGKASWRCSSSTAHVQEDDFVARPRGAHTRRMRA